MNYEWDEAKAESNHEKHGVSFDDVEGFDWDSAIEAQDMRYTEEVRMIALGKIGKRLHILVYTDRGDSCRVISLRKASKKEVARYEQT